MTLVEQIKAIHAKHFNKEFHEYRGTIVPAMVNDLKLKFFDDLWNSQQGYWTLEDSTEVRAVRKASELIQSCGLRATELAVD